MQTAIPLIGNPRLKKQVLSKINTSAHRVRLAMIMGCTENTIRGYISNNDVKLTQYAALEYIRKEVMQCLEVGELLEYKKQVA